MTYDNWKTTDFETIENDKKLDGFDLWLDREEDTEVLAGYVKKDLVLYVAEEGMDWDYPDEIHERFIDDFTDELADYYLESVI